PEEARILRRELARLTKRQRAAFLLHEWMGYSFAEAGKAMGVNESTARVHAHRAKEALRKALEFPSVSPPHGKPQVQTQEQRP
ncbi:MAG: RNA polymerase sigma factor, partial [Candidatus Eisenbacteria bacterium]